MSHTIDNPVLMVVDMQKGFLGSKSAHILPSILALIQFFNNAGLPVVFTRFHNNPESQFHRLIGWHRLSSSPEIDLIEEVAPFADTIIDKQVYTAFTAEFESLIAAHKWRTIVLCGVATESCVLKTAVDAFERGFVPLVVGDACASHAGDEAHRAGLMVLERFIGRRQVISKADLMTSILTGAGV